MTDFKPDMNAAFEVAKRCKKLTDQMDATLDSHGAKALRLAIAAMDETLKLGPILWPEGHPGRAQFEYGLRRSKERFRRRLQALTQ